LKTPDLRFSVEGKHFENKAFQKLYDNLVTDFLGFLQTQIQKCSEDLRVTDYGKKKHKMSKTLQ